MTVAATRKPSASDAAQIVLNTIQRPVIMIDTADYITFANADAEDFFRASAAVLAKNTLDWLIPYGSPVLSLVEQVRSRNAPVNEDRVDISSPRIGLDKIVDIYVAPVPEMPGSVVLMFQERPGDDPDPEPPVVGTVDDSDPGGRGEQDEDVERAADGGRVATRLFVAVRVGRAGGVLGF